MPVDYPLTILEEATSSWDPRLVLGEGGFATVYLGTFRDGEQVAIKRVRMPDTDTERFFAEKSMRAELETISGYAHENICQLLGSFVDTTSSDRFSSYILVYELCENGSLLDRLGCRDNKRKPVPALDEEQRLLVALGICRALEYLHVKAIPPIVHRDVKSPNILLDTKMRPKLADFGTVRQDELNDNNTHIKTETVIGTRCYMSPECESTLFLFVPST
jgi:serine/threonine protein kinase